jgi:hypothetical protein
LNKDFDRHLPVADAPWTKLIPVHGCPPGLDTGISLATHDFTSNPTVSSRDRRGDAGGDVKVF